MDRFKKEAIKDSVFALFISLVICAVILLLSGYNPLEAYAAIFRSSFSSVKGLVNALALSTPLIFTGLAFVVAKQVGMISLGAEGQLYLGAITSGAVAIFLPLPSYLLVPVALAAGMLAGAFWGYIPGKMKAKFGANEVISTLMLNYIGIFLVSYLINYPLLEKNGYLPQTDKIQEAAHLLKLYPKSQLTIAFIIAIAMAVTIKYVFEKTKFGYELTVVGLNRKAAETAGVRVGKTIVITMLISGAIASLAGASQVLGIQYCVVDGFSPGYGFEGVAVAALAANTPIGVIISGFVFGVLTNASYYLSRTTDIPMDFVYIIQAFVVLFVASPRLLEWVKSSIWRRK